ncbi:MAG: hypothetical protein ACYCSP_00940 [Acidobacteriaceae bacterium]
MNGPPAHGILMTLGFQIQDGMVSGLILAEDWKATNAKRNHGAVGAKVSEGLD